MTRYGDSFGDAAAEVFEEVRDLPAEEQLNRVQKEFFQWKGVIEQTDDVLVVGLKF